MRKTFILTLVFLAMAAGTVLAQEGIYLKVIRPENAPYFVAMPGQNIFADEYSTMILRIRSERNTTARLFWVSPFDRQVTEGKSILFSIVRSHGYREYTFNVRSWNRSWTGFINQVIIVPGNGADGIDIELARAETGNLLSLLRSGWQEFWSPGPRLISGPSVNNMRPTTLFGIPINFYAYAAVLLTFAASFGFYLFRMKDASSAFGASGRVTAQVIIACLSFMVFSQLISESFQLKLDVSRYGGKTLEGKQIESNGADLFSFFMDVKKTLPKRARAEIVFGGPNRSFNESRVPLHLYPLDFYSTKEVEYILVFDPDQDTAGRLAGKKGFGLFKKFNERAYILWKKK